jgi:hypothetical protein
MGIGRKKEWLIGILYLLIFVAGILSVVYFLEEPGYLSKISSHEDAIYRGGLFQLIMALFYLIVAYLFYTIVQKDDHKLTIVFLGLRFTSVAFHILGVVLLILFIPLGQYFQEAGLPENSYFHVLGEMLRGFRDLLNHGGMIFMYVLGSLVLYYILFKRKLVARWLSVLGCLGGLMTLLASLLYVFGFINLVTPLYMILNLPLALQEILLAIYLMTKGFNHQS